MFLAAIYMMILAALLVMIHHAPNVLLDIYITTIKLMHQIFNVRKHVQLVHYQTKIIYASHAQR
jgi:hypothetical protein